VVIQINILALLCYLLKYLFLSLEKFVMKKSYEIVVFSVCCIDQKTLQTFSKHLYTFHISTSHVYFTKMHNLFMECISQH